MLKLLLFLLFSHHTFALEIAKNITYTDILSHAELYIDKSKSLSIEEIKEKVFTPNHHKLLGFGYSPHFYVWIRFTLSNNSSNKIDKILEYDNPLTSHIAFYESNKLIKKEGLLSIPKGRITLHPIFHVKLQAHEEKTFYIKVYSDITTLIIKLHLWENETFYKKEIHYQVILALFFGAMGMILIYNLIIYLSTKQRSYLYYVLAFTGITIYYLIYKGVMSTYFFSSEQMSYIIKFSSFIVAIPVFFLALFTKDILDLKQYPQLNQFLNYSLMAFPLITIIVYFLDFNTIRSFFPVLLLFSILCITFFTLMKKQRQAKFLMIGWSIFFTSGLFMFLSSLGVYDIFVSFPYYIEFSLLAEAIAFSYSLADKLKELHKEKMVLQRNFIHYQEKETIRLSKIVEEKTSELKISLEEKKLLLRELNHRVKNSMQTISNFISLQIDETTDSHTEKVLQNLENRVFSISHLYALLHRKNNISYIDTYQYFSLLVENIEQSFQNKKIDISLKCAVTLNSDDAVYAGLILNEAITNTFQHAFTKQIHGNIWVTLHKIKKQYTFTITDNGVGYDAKQNKDTIGMTIIETLVKNQLHGTLKIHSYKGVKIHVTWSNDA